MYVQLAVTIEPCIFFTAAFETATLLRTQFIGDGERSIEWPKIVTEPKCDVPKELVVTTVSVLKTPNDLPLETFAQFNIDD